MEVASQPKVTEYDDQYGVIRIYHDSHVIRAIAHKQSNAWYTSVQKNQQTGAFASDSMVFLDPKDKLRITPVMLHPPLIKLLKAKIASYEKALQVPLEQSIQEEIITEAQPCARADSRSATPEPQELIAVADN